MRKLEREANLEQKMLNLHLNMKDFGDNIRTK